MGASLTGRGGSGGSGAAAFGSSRTSPRSSVPCLQKSPHSLPPSAASIDPAKTGAVYAAMHDKEPYPGVTVTRDIKYGPADRNILDVFTAQGATGTRPV